MTPPPHRATHPGLPLLILRWSARGLSLFSVGIVLLFVFGEGLHLERFTGRELAMFLFFPLGVCLGMVVAWRRECLGGGITVASLAAFYLVDWCASAHFPRGLTFIVLAAPGWLFLASGIWAHVSAKFPGK